MTAPARPSREAPAPAPVYALADVGILGASAVPDTIAELTRAGVRWIQIRAKSLRDDELFELVEACFASIRGLDHVSLWMDDRADVAALFPFAGLHLGQRDLPASAARRIVGSDMWIGMSCHDDRELAEAVADPDVDVIAVGPVFPTSSKERPDPVVGLDFVRRARAATEKPLVAIGGIEAESLSSVLEAGADSAAVLGAVCRGTLEEVANSARRLVRRASGGLP